MGSAAAFADRVWKKISLVRAALFFRIGLRHRHDLGRDRTTLLAGTHDRTAEIAGKWGAELRDAGIVGRQALQAVCCLATVGREQVLALLLAIRSLECIDQRATNAEPGHEAKSGQYAARDTGHARRLGSQPHGGRRALALYRASLAHELGLPSVLTMRTTC